MTPTPQVNGIQPLDGIPRVRVEGGSYQRGRQYGAQARARVRRSVQAYQQVFEYYAGWDWAQVRRAAAGFEAPIARFRPAYLEEMRGIAEGAGLDPADVLAINVRTEVMYAAKARLAPLAARAPLAPLAPLADRARPPAECSSFAIVPQAPDGKTLIGQNWDWLLHSADTLVLLEVSQDEGPDFVTVVEAGLLAKAGMNAAGLGLVTNAMVTDADVGAPGLPYHVLLRAMFDCTTVTEALMVLQAGERSSSANYLIAHASGTALDVEAAPGDFTRLYPLYPDHGLLLHTNHFQAPRSRPSDPVDLSLWAMPSSAVRLQRLQAMPPATLDDARRLLADHADYPYSICAHPEPGEHPLEQGATITSVLMNLTAGQMWVTAGNPCQARYQEVAWPASPAEASPADASPADAFPAETEAKATEDSPAARTRWASPV
jgi:isopenicillin-N N-acyltransferase-like protein